MRAAARVVGAALCLAAPPRRLFAGATPVPPPGPGCAGGVPATNQSGRAPDCPGRLTVHNASCDGNVGERWARRAEFHPGSECHGENDPNGVMFFNGVYHLFFQDHVPMQVGGHLASRDLVRWRRLPIAIWNDEWYDKDAVWTFSATVVGGVPRIVYPGIAGPNVSLGDCGKGPDGAGCFTHAVAVPADLSDPWLEDWVKPAYNPVVAGGIGIKSRDPSTAWRTAAGEWRYMNAAADIYSTWDWERFAHVGKLDNFGTGDCPDFFPVPRDCDGCGGGAPARRPTHVRAGGFGAVYSLGTYSDGDANTTGTWAPMEVDAKNRTVETKLDGNGPAVYYAAKSFSDGPRRIQWGWVRLGGKALEYVDEGGARYPGFHAGGCHGVGKLMTNTNSLPREVTYDPSLRRLLFFPVAETAALRAGVAARAGPQRVARGGVGLGAESLQSELRASFAVPAAPARVGVSVLAGAGRSVDLFIDFVPAPNATAAAWDVVAGYNTSSMLCQVYPHKAQPVPGDRTACPASTGTLRVKRTDTSLDIAVWTDNVFAEAFFAGGRAAWTVPLPCEAIVGGGGARVYADGAAELEEATLWKMGPVSYDNVGTADNRT